MPKIPAAITTTATAPITSFPEPLDPAEAGLGVTALGGGGGAGGGTIFCVDDTGVVPVDAGCATAPVRAAGGCAPVDCAGMDWVAGLTGTTGAAPIRVASPLSARARSKTPVELTMVELASEP